MAAPSGTTWGSTVGSYGRIGIYTSLSSTNTETTLKVEVWFWSKYSVSDSSNTLYYNNLASSGSATTSKGSVSISTTVASGDGWSTSNQKKLATYTTTYTRGTSAQTRYLYAKLANIDRVGGTMYASKTVSIPKLASYAVKYNANGGTGAPSSQTKYYGKSLTLSSTKPTRTGYTFQGWGTSATDTTVDYKAGESYTGNAALTLYAIWKINTYKITFNANGGTGGPTSQTKTYGKTLTITTSVPTRTGFDFQGWGTSASDTTVDYKAGGSYTANAADTLYAIWTKKTYTVTFNANGGTGAPANQTKTHDVALTLTSNVPTKENYNFKGWATSSTSTSVSYKAGGSYTTNANITLYAVWELAYKKPTISNIQVSRCDENGNSVGDDIELTSGLLSFVWTTDRAVSKVEFSWISASGEIVGSKEVATQIGGRTGTVSEVFGDNLLPADETFNIDIWVYDELGYAYKSITLEGYLFTIDMLGGGKGVAFGKPAELENTADFDFKVFLRERMTFVNNKCIYGTKPDGTVWEAFNPINESGNTVLGYDNYKEKDGNTNVYGNDVNIGVANTANPGTFRPYRRKGDTITISIRTAGYVTNSGKDVTFFIPFAIPIIGNPTITVASGSGFTLRQGEKYTHGSSASASVVPDSYSAALVSWAMGISVTAVFSDTTNVTNNDAIGIYWNGTITFS